MQHQQAETASGTRFRSDIQGLRAIAVVAVVLYHAGVPFLSGGYVGVDIFFVISGFLITGHLLKSLRTDGKIEFGSFYAKRVRRILPAAFVVIALTLIAALIWYPSVLIDEVWAGALAAAFYVPNYLFAANDTNYLAETIPSLFQHYWSLGIEEQFYLLWPLVLAGLYLLTKSRPKALFGMLAAIALLSFFFGVFLTYQSQPWAFFSLPTRAWELAAGGLAAFFLAYRPGLVSGTLAAVMGWCGLAGIIACTILFTGATPFPSYWAALPVVATLLVIVAGDSDARFGPSWVLSTPPMMFLGLISYSLYLVHWPLLQIPQGAVGFDSPLPLLVNLILAVIAVPVAWLMYKFIETPARRGKWLAGARPRRSLIVAGAASIAIAVLATGVLRISTTSTDHGTEVPAASSVSLPLEITEFVPTNLSPSLDAVSDDKPITYDDGCHLSVKETEAADCVYGDPNAPRIVLFGDSHAAQWFPALQEFAESNGLAVENHTKSSCSSATTDVFLDGVEYLECEQWRQSVLDRISDSAPVLVVMANYGDWYVNESGTETPDAWSDAVGVTLDEIDVPTVILSDTPEMPATPAVCLSQHLEDALECASEREDAINIEVDEAELSASNQHGSDYIDMNDYFCTDELCPPIVGNTLLYRDQHHMTTVYSEQLSAALGTELVEYLPE
ncbi:MAG: acyltransferase family protein [Gulosibacter sp.]|uniref:acyltransferase family protein n=1 Tax=Gulosibacter sp. TaxID=2817531 RepID=UPI003F8DF59A